MTSASGAPQALSVDLDQLEGASLLLLPVTHQGAAGLYPEWETGLARQLREAGVTVAWATKNRAYVHNFSAEVDAVLQVALLLVEPITQAAVAAIVGYLRGLVSPESKAPTEVEIHYATEVDLSTGKVSDFSVLTVPTDAPVDVVALVREFNSGRVAVIKAAQDRG
ncbi:hypothetical protein [Micromonospora zamorensis]|uniref:hypothetical protein n=1 Tax=Micromonospora zamorensis TaxID=709883 RepID=UPI003CED08D1